MNQIVCSQSELFFTSIQIGIIIGIIFDSIRIFRKMIHHPNFAVQIEDMLFWVFSGFMGFYMLYNCNYADIRPYIMLGMIMGASLYFLTFSILVMKVMTCIIELIKEITYRIYVRTMKPVRIIIRYIMIPINNFKRARTISAHNKKMRYREKLRKQYQLEADNMTEIYIKNNRG